MADLSGLRRLLELMGPEFGMIVSDTTGVFPGDRGLAERLAFIFNWSMVHRGEVATDVTYDRTKVLYTIAKHNSEISAAVQEYGDYLSGTGKYKKMASYWERMKEYEIKLARYNDLVHEAIVTGERKPAKSKRPKKPSIKGLPKRPKLKMPEFVTFIRSPFCVSFEITGHPGTQPYRFMAINAHLYYGNTRADRWQEFDALMDWTIGRVKGDDTYYSDYLLLGDLNLDFDKPKSDRKRLSDRLKSFDSDSNESVNVNFPFLDPHKGRRSVFRTNARLTETFDQIGLFFRDKRFPKYTENPNMDSGLHPCGPDYGVFNFADLFGEALVGKRIEDMTAAQKKKFFPRFEHKASDHMPLWLRLPLPRE